MNQPVKSRPVKSEIWFIKDFYTKYNESKIRKPRIQRKKCWTKIQSNEYIKFITSHANTCLPLSVNIQDGKQVYMLFDGNNRTNSILDFYHTPLSIMEDIIPQEFDSIKKQLQETPLNTLLQKRYTYAKFCQEHNCVLDRELENTFEKSWDVMIDKLEKLDFTNVHIQLTVYDNLNNEDMQHIYESINRGGMKLTEQDLLASSLANQQYDVHEEIKMEINEYYDDMNSGERLRMTDDVSKLNLFEILTGLQLLLHKKYGFIPELNLTKDLDIVFCIWKIQYDFITVPSIEQVNLFIRNIQQACAELHDIMVRMYDTAFAGFKKFHTLKKNHTIMCVLYLIHHQFTSQEKKQYIHKAILYHNILSELYTDVSIIPKYRLLDTFWRNSTGGTFSFKLLFKSIIDQTFQMPILRTVDIKEMLHKVLEQNIHCIKTRKPIKWFEAVALSAFYNQQVPSTTKLLTHQIDHIVPFSVRKNALVDICRLGNKQLIPESINAARKIKPITDKWVSDNKLLYQQYPTGEEYAQIYDGTNLHVELFNSMCIRREELYIEHILSSYVYA